MTGRQFVVCAAMLLLGLRERGDGAQNVTLQADVNHTHFHNWNIYIRYLGRLVTLIAYNAIFAHEKPKSIMSWPDPELRAARNELYPTSFRLGQGSSVPQNPSNSFRNGHVLFVCHIMTKSSQVSLCRPDLSCNSNRLRNPEM